jgi:HK97 family phage prohead protease
MQTLTRKTLSLAVKAPDSKGTFDGQIMFNPPGGDKDGERIAEWVNLPGTFPLMYQHNGAHDPGAIVGEVDVQQAGERVLLVRGRLDLSSPMGRAVHERMLLPSDDPLVLDQLSVGFSYRGTSKDENGVVALHDARLLEISLVHAGAQETRVSNVKSSTWTCTQSSLPDRVAAIAQQHGVTDAKRLGQLRRIAGSLRRDNAWLVKAGIADLIDRWTDPTLKVLSEQLDDLECPTRKRGDMRAVERQIEMLRADVQRELIQERLDHERLLTTPPVPHRLVLSPRMTELDVDG